MHQVVTLFDVDNTLLDNDRIIEDLRAFLRREVGPERERSYWEIFEQLRAELGYADYLGAIQRFRAAFPHEPQIPLISRFLIDYPFADRLFPNSIEVVERAKKWGPAVILTDGDVVFQPRKIERSGLAAAALGRILIYVHKENELDEVETRYPAEHYVLVDDKLRILTSVKKIWGTRVTTVFPRQGHYAHDPRVLAEYPPADRTLERIGEFLHADLQTLLQVRPGADPGT